MSLDTSSPFALVALMALLAIAPLTVLMLSSFLKISIVLSLLRNALGTQQVPSTIIINGLALVLTCFIMAPVLQQIYQAASAGDSSILFLKHSDFHTFSNEVSRIAEPHRQFLYKHAHEKDLALFMQLAAENNVQASATVHPEMSAADAGRQASFRVLMPAFITSQLKEAFQAGLLLYLPFLVIDFLVANILIAVGWQMMQPAFVSLPIKLLLFVLVDGWFLIVRSLVLSYA